MRAVPPAPLGDSISVRSAPYRAPMTETEISAATAIWLGAIRQAALLEFLGITTPEKRDHFAGCLLRAATAITDKAETEDNPALTEAYAIVREEACQLMTSKET